MPNPDIQIYGIRHHGPGSARSLAEALDRQRPTVVLVEGPPDADSILPLAAHAEMSPPVAILVYVPDQPRRSVYYPFALFSPEWQAIQWALRNNVPVRFMDLPQSIQLAIDRPEFGDTADADTTGEDEEHSSDVAPDAPAPATGNLPKSPAEIEAANLRRDPLQAVAEAAGYEDGERWWDHMVEQRSDGGGDIFAGILEIMAALRTEADSASPPEPRELQREAWMRQTVRAAQREGHERIAVVCGAWHSPALAGLGPAKADKTILDGLPKVKTAASWIPWTYSRLSYRTGYGAGIESPGWYHHLWTFGQNSPATEADVSVPSESRPEAGLIAASWLTRVAHLLREQDLDAPPASIIEAVRLAECIATLRGRPLPDLSELNEAARTVLCFGSDIPMRVISEKLIVGEVLGEVPEDAPSVPLQQDLQRIQKRLRMPPEAGQKTIDLDLRTPGGLERSELLHRLNLLDIPWGQPERSGGGKGTFHELWRIQWRPEFAISLIEHGVWGNTVADASSHFAADRAAKAPDLPTLTSLLESVMLARLPEALNRVMERLEDVSAHAADIQHLMAALPPLANVLRYGDVRGTDTSMVAHTVDGLVARICVGLPPACASLDDDAAARMAAHITNTNGAIVLLQNDTHIGEWREALIRLAERPNLHGRIGGQCVRLLLDAGEFTADEAGRQMSLALSTAVDPAQAAAWVEGFLAGSGLLLVHDSRLWRILDDWVSGLGDDHFTALLPLLRRTFSTFSAPERRQLGEQAKSGRARSLPTDDTDAIDHARAAEALPYAMQLLGLA